MLRLRTWHILIFVAASMAVAVFWSRWQNPVKRGVASESSSSVSTVTLRNDFARAEELAESVMGQASVGNEDQICHCLARGQSQKILKFDLAEACTGGDAEQSRAWEKISPLYRGTRSISPAEFPRACVLAALPADHCRTEARVNILYNAYTDAFSCLDLPRKDWWPWWAASGHLEASSHFDVEMTKRSPLEFSNENPACRRLAGALATGGQSTPLQMVWSGAVSLAKNWDDLEKAFSENHYWHRSTEAGTDSHSLISLNELIEKAGWPESEHSSEKIREIRERLKMLAWLGSPDLGVRTMTDLLANFFISRESGHLPVQLADFRISKMGDREVAGAEDWAHFYRQYLPQGLAGDHDTFLHQLQFVEQMNQKLKESTCASDSFLQF